MPPEILETFRRSLPPGTCDDVDKLQAMLAEGILASGWVGPCGCVLYPHCLLVHSASFCRAHGCVMQSELGLATGGPVGGRRLSEAVSLNL
eukprot:COSAG02_NODE_37858_length_436_cov_1.373887_2_plen_90_part_01